MTKFKVPLQKGIIQVGEVLVLLTGEKSCHIQGIHSDVYKIGSLEIPTTTGLLFCLFEKNTFEVDASQNAKNVNGNKKQER